MVKEATKPQTKHADRMTLPSSSQKYSQMYLRVHSSQKRLKSLIPPSSFSYLSRAKVLTSISHQIKQLLSIFMHRTSSPLS